MRDGDMGGAGEEQEAGLQDYLAVLQRRIWYIVVPFVLLFPLCVAVVLLLPPVYLSSGRILIEDPDIPRELAMPTIASAADKRLQIINQRVMTADNLARIIQSYNLYAKERQRMPEEDVVEAMREKIKMELITVQNGGAAVAFTVSFEDREPQVAQAVAEQLVSLFLKENLRDRQFRATQTAAFFESETKRLEAVITDLESQLAELRKTHYGSLPEQLDFNQQLIARAEEELRGLDRQVQTTKERRIYLQAELLRITPSIPIAENGALGPAAQLKVARAQLAAVSSRYGAEHPDVVRLRREVEALEKESGGSASDRSSWQKDLKRAQAELTTARQKYTENHPEVIRLSRQVDALRASLATAAGAQAQGGGGDAPDNPAYIQLRAQLQSADLELDGYERQRTAIRQRITDYERRVENTPNVQQTYQGLSRALDAATTEYREVREKQTAAQMGELLETERKSERFSLIEPPVMPNTPIKPNRRNLLLLSFVLSAGAGVGLALLLEMMDRSVRSARELGRVAGMPPLAVIPYIRTDVEVARSWRLRAAFGVGLLALVTGAATAVHLYVMPLGMALLTIEERLGTTLLTGGT
ncbi:MAG: hypothetical protein U1E42_03210 [Rhodospirillales bacterium]